MINIKIGLDVASNNTGIALFVENDLLVCGLIKSNYKGNFSGEKLKQDSLHIQNEIFKFVNLLNPLKQESVKIMLAIEMSHHGNKKVGQILSVYVGVFAELLINSIMLFFPLAILEVKLVTPKEWQLRAFAKELEREDGKLESIERAKRFIENSKYKNAFENLEINDDIADAINIASLSHVIRDEFFVGQQTRQRKELKTKNQIAIAKITTELNKIYDKLREKENKRIKKIINSKKWQKTKNKIESISLIELADKQQNLRIEKYKEKLEALEASTKEIQKFYIKGKIE